MRKQREVLPENYDMVIAEINQRFYPVRIQRSEEGDFVFNHIAQFTWSFEDEWLIPYAMGPRHTTGIVSFSTYADAIMFCHRREEHWGLIYDWEKLVAMTDLYPDRSIWYVEEIGRLTGATPRISTSLTEAYAGVYDAKRIYHGAYASNVHEAVVALYEAVASAHGSIQHEDAPVDASEVGVSA